MRVQRLSYLVALVMPSLGRAGSRQLSQALQNRAMALAVKLFEKWFGGATPMRVPPGGVVRMLDGSVLFDHDQTLVVSGTTRKEFRKRRKEMERVAAQVGKMLGQESVAVIAFPSDSFIVFLEPS